MENGGMKAATRDLQTLFGVGVMGTLTDGQLLELFVARREEAVFEAVVLRHGPMVWGVCRRVLQDHHDAEDAFQATFLVLTRKAASVVPREKLGNWLYGVAYQTAMKARATRAKRRVREGQMPDMPESEGVREGERDDLLPLLDRELSRLPEKYRIPILLCELEGKTHREAAEQLGWPIGSLSGRLSRARALLARRLSQRGVSLSGGALAVLLAQEAASASVPTKLVHSTAQAASLFATGQAVTAGVVSTEVAALTGEVLKMMLLSKIKIATAVLLVGVTLAVAGTSLAYSAKDPEEEAGRFIQGEKAADQRTQVQESQTIGDTVLPGKRQSIFGGGPDEPLYIRNGNLFFVNSPVGDRFSVYDAASKKASTLRLPGSKASPLNVTPILGEGLVSLGLDGPRVTSLYIFSIKDWKWYVQDLKEPAAGAMSPVLSQSVAGYTQGRNIYAFSTEVKRWSVLELPPEAPEKPDMTLTSDSVVVEYDGHVHEFSGKTGEWKHHDLRTLIDSAIESTEGGAK